MTFKGPFQPKPFYDSMISCLSNMVLFLEYLIYAHSFDHLEASTMFLRSMELLTLATESLAGV